MPQISISLIKTYCTVLLFSALEMICLRWLFHSALGMEIGWTGMTDFDIAIPLAVSLFITLMVLKNKTEILPSLQKDFLRLNLFLTASLVLLSTEVSQQGHFTNITYALWLFLLLSTFLSSLCVWIPPQYYVANENSWVLFPAVILSVAVGIYQKFYEVLWPSLIPVTGKVTCAVLRPLLGSSLRCSIEEPMKMVLKEKYFWADIAAGCSGLDGQLFLIIAFLILYSLYGKKVQLWRWGGFLITGVLSMFLANVLRIVIFFLIGAISVRTSYYEFGRNTMLFLFHAHAGWVLYSVNLYFLQSFLLKPGRIKSLVPAFRQVSIS